MGITSTRLLEWTADSLDTVRQYEAYYQQRVEEIKYDKLLEFIIGVSIPLLAISAYFFYKHYQIRQWKKGVFPLDLPNTVTNLMEAYASLTVYFITLDRFHQMRKIAFLKTYFLQTYHRVPKDYDVIIDRNFHYPVHPVSVIKWVNQYANEGTKKQLLQYLVSLCHVDEVLKQKEYDALKVLTKHLQLELPFLEECIFYHRRGKQEKTATNGQTTVKQPSVSLRKKYADILGIDEKATENEVKQRFRQLAKRYHPDRFANESIEQQEQAHQRFLEIQEAYEHLMKK